MSSWSPSPRAGSWPRCPLAGGPAIADPFHRTAALVQMLELRAQQLRVSAKVAPGAAARIMAALNRPALRPN